jgi:hypothetical protein
VSLTSCDKVRSIAQMLGNEQKAWQIEAGLIRSRHLGGRRRAMPGRNNGSLRRLTPIEGGRKRMNLTRGQLYLAAAVVAIAFLLGILVGHYLG